jgi:hypothetical protein
MSSRKWVAVSRTGIGNQKNRWWVAGGSSRWLKTDHTSSLKPKYEEKVSKKKKTT